jgi:hypothetical protein
MKKVILALMLCGFVAPVFADKPAPHFVPHKKHKKVVVVVPPTVLPPVVIPPIEHVVLPPPMIVVVPPMPPTIKPVAAPVMLCKAGCVPESKVFLTSAHLAVGVGAQAPWASGLVGLRMEFPGVMLGLEPFVSLPYGVGADGLLYMYRGPVVQIPIAFGFMINWNYNQKTGMFGSDAKFLSDQDINRVIDLRMGAGVQVKLKCSTKLTVDWRVSIPDPAKLDNENNVCMSCGNHAHKLDANTAVGNAFAQSQILVGLLF